MVPRLPRLRFLEGAHHDEDDTPVLDCFDRSCDVGTAIADAVDFVNNRCGW